MALDLADPDLAAGPVIDAEARDAYRADAAGDRDRSAGLAAEQKALIAELRGASGSGVTLAGLALRPSAPAPPSAAASVMLWSASRSLTRRWVATWRIPSGLAATASTSPTRLSTGPPGRRRTLCDAIHA